MTEDAEREREREREGRTEKGKRKTLHALLDVYRFSSDLWGKIETSRGSV